MSNYNFHYKLYDAFLGSCEKKRHKESYHRQRIDSLQGDREEKSKLRSHLQSNSPDCRRVSAI